jgi:hypothetical protein
LGIELRIKLIIGILLLVVAGFVFYFSALNYLNPYFESRATLNHDANSCSFIFFDNDAKDSCYDGVAFSKNDLTICDKESPLSHKETCYFSVAVNLQDMSICNKITDTIYKGACQINVYIAQASAAKNPDLCNNLSNQSNRDFCLVQVARKIKDVTVCDKIMDAVKSAECKQYFQ